MSVVGTAVIEDRYRYMLSRTWLSNSPRLCWIMLNPSTADAFRDDVTIKRCTGFALRAGCGGIDVVNLFAFRSAYPYSLTTAPDPVGPKNDDAIQLAITHPDCERVVAAWGCDPQLWEKPILRDRAAAVCELVRQTGKQLWCLGLTARGGPKHPSRLAYATRFVAWKGF